MNVRVDVPQVSAFQAVEGMRGHFIRAFGRSLVGRRLARAAWPVFRTALLHGSGLHGAAEHARTAAEERNRETLLVAQWTGGRIRRTVDRAIREATTAR